MTNISPRTWVLMGFGISLLSVVINIFVLDSINGRIKEADDEVSKLTASLSYQAAEVNQAEIQRDLFNVLNHVSQLATGNEKISAGEDSILILHKYMKRRYAAVNDIPMHEMLKADNEEWAPLFEYNLKYLEANKKAQEGKVDEAERLRKEADELSKREFRPKSELGKELTDLASTVDIDEMAKKSTDEIYLTITPFIKSSNEQFIANYEKKNARIKELQDKKQNLSRWANIATYLAISLQLFGLMFVLTKDLAKDMKGRRDRAAKEAVKSRTEA